MLTCLVTDGATGRKGCSGGVITDLFLGMFDMREERFLDSLVYWAKDVDFEIRFRQPQKACRRLFVAWRSDEFFSMPPAHRAELFVSLPVASSVMTRCAYYMCRICE